MLIESFVNHSTVRSRHSSIPLNNRALEGEGIRMCYWMNEIQSSEPRSYPAMSSSESMPLLGPDVNTVDQNDMIELERHHYVSTLAQILNL
jgi:hypothetical protein